MSRLEVLVTTMHQTDFSKYDLMNLSTNAVLANQADSDFTEEKLINGSKVKLVTKSERGTSKNRNTAIDNISEEAEVIMFADDDLIFRDGYEEMVMAEFEKNPDADAIKFNLNIISGRKLSMRTIEQFKKVTRREVTSYGVCAVAIRKNVLLEKALRFNERFGPGTDNYSGEDSIFLQEMFKKGVSLYVSPFCLADVDQSESSWFEGYNEKYFIVSGMIINECYPLLSYPLVLRSAIKAAKRGNTKLSLWEIICCYYKGILKNIKEKAVRK